LTVETKTKVVIVGGGTAGWMAAASLSKLLSKSVAVTLVESDEIGTIGVGEATIPPIRTLHKLLGIDEQSFIRATNATFKLGINFENWGNVDQEYFHSFGITGKECWAGEFHHFWLRANERGNTVPFGEYCYELMAAKAGKFGISSQQPINFAYHLDATKYAQFLREFSEKNGTERIEGKVSEVTQNPETGFIESITINNKLKIDGDLFIDCTGFKGLLIEQTLHTGYDDWSHWLASDSAVAVQTQLTHPPSPYTRSIAHEFGWQWQIPLQNRVGNGIVYSSRFVDDKAAMKRLIESTEGTTLTEPKTIKFKTGRRRKGWNKNCVALGLASGFIEPLESTSIHLIMTGIVRLMRLFPFDGIKQAAIDEYNDKLTSELNSIRDFIVMHYKVSARNDSAMWDHYRTMELPDSLSHKIDLFRETGRVFLDDGDVFRVDSWTQVMLGQGILPKQYHKIAAQMSDNELSRFLNNIHQGHKQAVENLPTHEQFIKQYCLATMN
jgi:tryptophan halogenase